MYCLYVCMFKVHLFKSSCFYVEKLVIHVIESKIINYIR